MVRVLNYVGYIYSISVFTFAIILAGLYHTGQLQPKLLNEIGISAYTKSFESQASTTTRGTTSLMTGLKTGEKTKMFALPQ